MGSHFKIPLDLKFEVVLFVKMDQFGSCIVTYHLFIGDFYFNYHNYFGDEMTIEINKVNESGLKILFGEQQLYHN